VRGIPAAPAAAQPACWPGEYGLLLLRYVGKAPDKRPWRGAATGTIYPFGPGDTLYVDSRDAELFLKPLRGDGAAFREV